MFVLTRRHIGSIMSDMKYAIQVHPISDWNTSQHHARKLCNALLSSGDEIVAVFFYGSSSHIAGVDSTHDWHDWDTTKSPLLVCSTLTQQMSINPSDSPIFTVTGMARWMKLSEQADQLVTIP